MASLNITHENQSPSNQHYHLGFSNTAIFNSSTVCLFGSAGNPDKDSPTLQNHIDGSPTSLTSLQPLRTYLVPHLWTWGEGKDTKNTTAVWPNSQPARLAFIHPSSHACVKIMRCLLMHACMLHTRILHTPEVSI